ncbi:MAG: DNA-3-methyladenine glycosylase I [Propionibacteriaceae bacterium]|nr:DNA-3-methyladenine glycosylase I [Propionibacteriaceae bacterium]
MQRCFGSGDPLYEAYHDQEWGRSVPDSPHESALFERLVLEGFQSGLSWVTVLRKREAFRAAFAGFDPTKVAAFTAEDEQRLLADQGIIRNQAKIRAAIGNAQALLRLHADGLRLADLLAKHAPAPRPEPPRTLADVPGSTAESKALSQRLKKLGFRFVGPVTMYATMQAIGLVNDHLADCWVRQIPQDAPAV